MMVLLVGSIERQAGRYFDFATRWRNPFGVRTFRRWVRQPYNRAANGTNRVPSWLVFKIVGIVRHHAIQNSAVIATGLITNIFVIVSILSAFPWVRKSVFQFQCWICRQLTPQLAIIITYLRSTIALLDGWV
jgi:hypothetical protein